MGTETTTSLDQIDLTDASVWEKAPPRRLHSNLINGIKETRISYDVC